MILGAEINQLWGRLIADVDNFFHLVAQGFNSTSRGDGDQQQHGGRPQIIPPMPRRQAAQ